MVTQPHYLLICDSVISSPATVNNQLVPSVGLGRWHFVLERMDGPERLEVADGESYIHHDRLALLAVVRGLEALEQASLVRLVTTSRYVDRGLRFGLPNWRETNYQWESFGERKPIRNADLWRRVDVAMQYHEVTCRLLKSNVGTADSLVEEFSAQQIEKTIPDAAVASVAVASSHFTVGSDSSIGETDGRAEAHTELVARFSPAKVAYRVDSPHRSILAPRARTARPTQVANQPAARLQWWEMAAKWDSPAAMERSSEKSACGF